MGGWVRRTVTGSSSKRTMVAVCVSDFRVELLVSFVSRAQQVGVY